MQEICENMLNSLRTSWLKMALGPPERGRAEEKEIKQVVASFACSVVFAFRRKDESPSFCLAFLLSNIFSNINRKKHRN